MHQGLGCRHACKRPPAATTAAATGAVGTAAAATSAVGTTAAATSAAHHPTWPYSSGASPAGQPFTACTTTSGRPACARPMSDGLQVQQRTRRVQSREVCVVWACGYLSVCVSVSV
jgi:hypothetical protein